MNLNLKKKTILSSSLKKIEREPVAVRIILGSKMIIVSSQSYLYILYSIYASLYICITTYRFGYKYYSWNFQIQILGQRKCCDN